MRIPTFKEAVAISENDTVYVFPIDNPSVVFIWDEYYSDDWGFWYLVADGQAYKVVLHPRGPSASFGGVHDSWDDVLKRPAVRIPPRVFFILTRISSSYLDYFREPKVVSIKDFDKGSVRSLAATLKSQLYDRIVEDAFYGFDEWEEGAYEEPGEEDPCIDAEDPDDCEG